MNFVDKFYYIMNHPLDRDPKDYYENDIEIMPQMVNPETKEIDCDASKNTEVAFWVEFSYQDKTPEEHVGYLGETCSFHDYELNTGAETYEKAVEKLFDLVIAKYGYCEAD